MADKRRKWNRNLCAEREKAEKYKRKKDKAKTEPKRREIVIPIQRKLWRLLKPLLTYELFLIEQPSLLALILMSVYDRRLSGRAYARDIRSCISNRQSGGDPGSLETVQKDEGMFRNRKNGGVRQRQPPVFSAGYDLRPSPEHCHERDRLYQNLSGYQDMASKIYAKDKNPLAS